MRRRASIARTTAWMLAASPLVLFGVVPLLILAWRAVTGGSSGALARPETWWLLVRSLAFAAFVAALATIIGTAAACGLGCLPTRARRTVLVLLTLPLVLPPYVHAIAWTTLLSPSSVVGRPACGALARLTGAPPASIADAVYSYPMAVTVLALALFPVPLLFVRAALSHAPWTLVEAARNCGAGRWRAFLVARWPFVRVAAGSGALIVFLVAASDLGVPTVLKVHVFNFEVFTQLGAFNDTASATLLAMPLVASGLGAVWLERRSSALLAVRPDDRAASQPEPCGSIAAYAALAGLLTIALASAILPLGAVAVEGMRLDALAQAAAIARTPAWWTFLYAGCAAVTVTAIGFVLAWLSRGWSIGAEWLPVLGFAVPGSILALALLAAAEVVPLLRAAPAAAVVVAALVARLALVGHRIIDAGVQAVPQSYVEAAHLAGATGFQTARSIVAPLVAPHLLAAGAAVFILAAAEIGSTILLHPPGGETLPIALYAVEANSPRRLVAALTLIIAAAPICVAIVVAGAIRARRT